MVGSLIGRHFFEGFTGTLNAVAAREAVKLDVHAYVRLQSTRFVGVPA
jgi:hypothetical protein|eukprot:COSAG01_NODE_546_length_15649_cov_21.047395_6_plen_48_part_00